MNKNNLQSLLFKVKEKSEQMVSFKIAILGILLALLMLNKVNAQTCTLLNVYNHSGSQVARINSSSGTCVLPSGVTMTWTHTGANRGLQSYGCSPYDPTYWMDGGSMVITFSQPVNNLGLLFWGLDGTDVANLSVNSGTLTLVRDYVDLCPTYSGGTPPFVSGNAVNGGGSSTVYFGQIGVTAKSTTPFTTLSFSIVSGGAGYGLLGVQSVGLSCIAGTTAPSLSATTVNNACPAVNANLNSVHNGIIPSGASLVWFTNNAHTGVPYATPTAATANTYYAFYYDNTNNCYSPASSAVTVTISICCAAGTTAPVIN